MFLSKLVLNERSTQVHRDLANAHKLHQRIMQGFPDEQKVESPRQDWQILYRQEPDPQSNLILVQSNQEPDWSKLPSEYLEPEISEPCVKPIDISRWQLDSNHPLQFRIKVNPVKRDAKTRKLIPLYKREEHLAWFHHKAEQSGFQINTIDSIPVPNIIGSKGKGKGQIKLFSVLLQGQLQVRDREKFITAICQGIGKGRSYGCGLLSIAKYR